MMTKNSISTCLMSFCLCLMMTLLALNPAISTASETENKVIGYRLNDVLNRAGQQEMLLQQIFKAYCQLGQNQFYVQPDLKLRQAINHYEQGLQFLERLSEMDVITTSLNTIDSMWGQYKTMLLEPAVKENVPQLLQLTEQLLKISRQMVQELAKTSTDELAQVIMVSSGQRMLSQRLELFYLLQNWGFEEDIYAAELVRAKKQFVSAQTYLKAYQANTDELNTLLQQAEKSFTLLVYSLEENDSTFIISLTVSQLLKYMDDATNLYSSM